MTLDLDLTITLPDGSTAGVAGTISEASPQPAGLQPNAMAEWLGMLDPSELEAIALEQQSTTIGSYTAVLLSILQKWASGTS